MKRENIFISENRTAKRVAATKFIAPGDVPAFDCLIRFGKEENDVTMQNCNIKDSTIVKCSPEDTYDFEVGALIALMKMCGFDKSYKAIEEAFKYNSYDTKKTKELERAYKASNDDKAKLVEYYQREIKKLEAENEKLKLDCEKLCHGYNGSDMIFCGGRQNGKQYTLLVDLFKKLDQKKVDAAYKEAYNTTLPLWQKEVLNQMYGIYQKSKEKIEIHIEVKLSTKREEMWENILGVTKCSSVEIKVAKENITSFLRELQDKIPEVRWNGSECPPVDLSVPDWFKHDYIYFSLFRNYDKGNLRLCYDDKPHSWVRIKVDYLPPMRWDLFKKGRIVIGVKNNNELEEFRKEVKINIGIKDIPTCPTSLCAFYSFDKDNYKIILSIGEPNIPKIDGHKVYYWEDVR